MEGYDILYPVQKEVGGDVIKECKENRGVPKARKRITDKYYDYSIQLL